MSSSIPGTWLKRRWRWLVLSGAALSVLLIISGAASLRSGDELVQVREVAHITHFYDCLGSVTARDQRPVFSPVTGESTKILELIPEGSLVARGDLLCVVDSYGARQRSQTTRRDIANRHDEYLALQVNEQLEAEAFEHFEEEQSRTIEQSERDLVGYCESEAPLKRLQLHNRSQQAANQLADRQQRLSDIEELLDKGYASLAELERARREQVAATAVLEEAVRSERLYLDARQQQEIAAREEAVRQARFRLIEARARRAAEHQLNRARMATMAAAIEDLKQSLGALEAEIEACRISAERAGIVVYGLTYDKQTGLRPIRVGDTVWSNDVILNLTELSRMDLVAQIPEEQMRDIRPHLEAMIVLTAQPLQMFSGKVRTVGVVSGRDDAGLQRVVEVRIGLDRPPDWIRPAMTGRARIRVHEFHDALIVPFSAVGFDDQGPFVLRHRLWHNRRHPLTIKGPVEDGVVVAADTGLEAGDWVQREVPAS